VHPDPNRSGTCADNRPNLVVRETRSVAQCEQVLLLRWEQTDHCVQLRHAFAGEELLLDVRLSASGVERERLHRRPAVNVTHRVPCDLEQPTREAAVTAKAPELRERGREHRARYVLARRDVSNPQAGIATDTLELAVVQREEHARLLARGRHERRIGIDLASAQRRRLADRPHLHDRLIFSLSS